MDKKIILLFLFALLIRIGYVAFYPPLPIDGDAGAYLDLGINLFEGNGYARDGVEETRRAPGYPFFLTSLFLLFGKNLLFVKLLQALISTLTVVLIYSFARKLFNRKVAACSGLLASFYFPFVFYSGLILTETLYTFLLIVGFYILFSFKKTSAIISGIFFGFAALIRTESLLIVLFVLFAIFLSTNNKKKVLITGCLVLLFLFLIISPWSIRNYTLYNQFFLVNTQYGLDLVMATHSAFDYKLDTLSLPENLLASEELTPVEQARFYSNLAKKTLVESPFFYLKNSVRRFFKFWLGSHTVALNGFTESFSQSFKQKHYFVFFTKVSLIISNTLLILLGLIGFIKFLRDEKFNGFQKALFISPIVSKVLIHTFTIGVSRFQIPIMPFVLMLAGYYLYNFFDNLSSVRKFT